MIDSSFQEDLHGSCSHLVFMGFMGFHHFQQSVGGNLIRPETLGSLCFAAGLSHFSTVPTDPALDFPLPLPFHPL